MSTTTTDQLPKESQSWNDSFLLGIPLVDEQHKILIALFDEVITISQEENNSEKILPLLNELQRYTHYHFDTEEALMHQENIQGIDFHIKQHTLFKKKIADFMIANSYKNRVLLNQIILFLRKWLVVHIRDTDSKTLKQ